tara:strand:- start:670 stop:3003 length:2334 start_codon:yes stop_codon:yes gene_type:complete
MKLKNSFSFFIFFLPISLIYFSVKNIKTSNISEANSVFSNFKDVIPDAIEPPCTNIVNDSLINDIKIEIPKSRQWQSNIIKAYINSGSITDKFKKRFNAFVYYENKNGICKQRAKIRISGDNKDHIKSIDGNPVASLDVTLKDGSINGVRKFKLFLPNSRNGDNEIFVANLFSELGLLSPRTRAMKVKVNKQSLKMIFQEKLAKEMIENNNLRESVLIKTNDSLMLKLRKESSAEDDLNWFNSFVYPSIINQKWLSKGEPNLQIGFKALNLFSSAIDESTNGFINPDIPFDISLLSKTDDSKKIQNDQSFFSLLSIISRSLHINYKHNLRYYYEPFHDSLIPVYYDADSQILNSQISFAEYLDMANWNNNELHLAMLSKNSEFYNFYDAYERLNKLDIDQFQKRLEKSGLPLSQERILSIKNELFDNLDFINKINQEIQKNPLLKKTFVKEGSITEKKFKDVVDNVRLISGKNFDDLKVCSIKSTDCYKSNLSKENFYKISQGYHSIAGNRYFYLNRDSENLFTKKQHKINNLKINNLINMKIVGNPEYKIDEEKRKIEISFKSNIDKVIFYDSYIDGWNIVGIAQKDLIPIQNNSRIDNILSTGSLVIQDSILKDLKISFENGINEDSINIIRTSGSIDKINVKDSFQDSIDLDFSSLNIKEIQVERAGNDCLDLSAGNYFINNFLSNQCKDKGLSAGEGSNIIINNLVVQKSSMAIVIKDSSRAKILDGNVIDSEICLAIYRKKPEFLGADLTMPRETCEGRKVYVQDKSTLNYL